MAQATGKGRPTPKRSQANTTRRKAVAPPPANRREAARRARAKDAERRAAERAALRSGDESNLPAFFRGPEKAAVREAVDSRRGIGWLALPAFLLNLGAFVAPTLPLRVASAWLSFALMTAVAVDAMLNARRIRRLLAERFPEGTKDKRGALVRYGIARGFQRRSRRLPPPKTG